MAKVVFQMWSLYCSKSVQPWQLMCSSHLASAPHTPRGIHFHLARRATHLHQLAAEQSFSKRGPQSSSSSSSSSPWRLVRNANAPSHPSPTDSGILEVGSVICVLISPSDNLEPHQRARSLRVTSAVQRCASIPFDQRL